MIYKFILPLKPIVNGFYVVALSTLLSGISLSVNAQEVISHSQMVFTINSSIGQDAVILGKPVICFGNVNYQILSDNMVKRLVSFERIGESAEKLMKSFRHSKKSIIRYLAIMIDQSCPINLYSTIFRKQGVFKLADSNYNKEVVKLSLF